MIKLVSAFTEKNILDANYIKIAATVKAYGSSMKFYTLYSDGNGTLIMKLDRHITVYGENFDVSEVKKFIEVIGCDGITCSETAAKLLGYGYTAYNVVKAEKGMAVAVNRSPSCDEIYEALKTGDDGDIALFDKTAFIADLSHRIRHETAFAVTYKDSVCVVPYIIDCGALICGVATGKDSRGLGFGGMCVSSAVKIAGRPCLAVCTDTVLPFYKKYGFTPVSKNAEIIFRQ